MKIFLTLFFLWIASFSLYGQVRAKDAREVQEPCGSPLSRLEGSMLFKCGIDAFGRHYSGLFLIKAMPDSSTRVVFMSELGLNLLDMSYRNDTFLLVSAQEFLQRKTILRALENDFRTLLLDLSQVPNVRKLSVEDSRGCDLQFRHKRQRYIYLDGPWPRNMEIHRRKFLINRTTYRIWQEEGMQIRIRHKGPRMKLKLQEIAR